MRSLSRLEVLVVAASLLTFLLFGSAWIHLPGPQQDELAYVPVLLPALRSHVEFALQVRDQAFPLMIMSYAGALKGWLLWLWFLVIPRGVPGYRAFGIAIGVVTVWLVFRFVRLYYGRPIALLTTALVATDPSFLHTIRLDWGPVALMHVFKMGGLCLLARWLSDGSSWGSLTFGLFLFGLGLWDKATFVWILAGLGATVVLLFPRETMKRLRDHPAALPVGVLALLLGASPLLYYNLNRQGETWRQRGRLELRWSKLHEAESTFRGNFVPELTGEHQLDSSPPAHDIVFPRLADCMYRLGIARRTVQLPLLALALLILPLNLWIGGGDWARRLLFPLLASILIYACMFFSFGGGGSVNHVIMLQPFPLLFLATSLWIAAERWPRLTLRAAAVLIAGVAIVVNLSFNARHLAIYTRTGGTRGFTDAVYRLVPFLARSPGSGLYALDWGLSNPVMFLGEPWNLRVDDYFFAILEPRDPGHSQWIEGLRELMRDPNNIFLLHSPQRSFYSGPARDFFKLARTGIEMRRIASFQERSGEVAYEVYQHAREGPRHSGD